MLDARGGLPGQALGGIGHPPGGAYTCRMLTRSGVARVLGKSIATVRRLEGTDLHPERDSNGVWLFDVGEVQGVARDRRRDSRANARSSSPAQSAWFSRVMRQRASAKPSCIKEAERCQQSDRRDLISLACDLVGELRGMSPSQRASLDDEFWELLGEVMRRVRDDK